MQVLITISPLAWEAWPPRSPKRVKPFSRTRTIGSGMLRHSLHHQLPPAHSHHHPAAQPAPGQRGVLAPALEGRRIDNPVRIRVDQDPVVAHRLANYGARPFHTGPVDNRSRQA